MMNNHDPNPFAMNTRETMDRLRTHATLVLGYRPSTAYVTSALLREVMKGKATDSDAMMTLARTLFAENKEAIQ